MRSSSRFEKFFIISKDKKIDLYNGQTYVDFSINMLQENIENEFVRELIRVVSIHKC